ncbi:prolyl oligopeptidase [Bradyrhizobium japonicum]|uniref:prolyl oligopeptidase family serine peptidase n=1 Tax=Bradyrhizobium elkanii TaxID=29448 RepID=UPI000367EA54|nr:prolyl oligopeptidase family serine peptidase [Bradyrhizobium elkanii]MCP1728954.1 prolyl oligopeptidase [Bradyrhizobium elkanii]MCS3573079.1 prolyl oligopeptidase [Bradyrhizobium elkanii]MCS3594228.1 prolyl oligopeptidase [Bradyrhizobium elkanii]MCS3623672.1 prolyl oligopeptidase [Bradyrhizobium elkanii]UQD79882.1 S9 family peptidase [Bradyrhizobium elkanii USDA 76]
MNTSLLSAALPSIARATSTAISQERTTMTTNDPSLWLEDIEGQDALAWARAENEKTLGVLQSDPRYQRFYEQALSILQAKDRIAYVSLGRRGLENFWQDENHVRGIWRRTTMESYCSEDPQWETILDVDALAVAENRNWVFQGGSSLRPEERLCLIHLSDGGKDAASIREFDREANSFVAGGFYLLEGKQNVSWVDGDTLLVARDWGEGSLTQAGYPFVVKELKRAQPLSRAREIFRGEPTDVQTVPLVLRDSEGQVHATGAIRFISSVERDYVVFRPDGPIRLNLPKKAAIVGLASGRLLVELDEEWEPGDVRFGTGSLISYDLAEWKQDPLRAKASLVFQPGPRQALSGVSRTKNLLILTILENVQSKALVYKYDQGAWSVTPIQLPQHANVSVSATSDQADQAMFAISNYLRPTSIWYFDAETEKLEELKTTPTAFDASNHVVDQFEATSRDGTSIPYFLVRPKNARFDGAIPTLLYGYGGFQASLLPSYLGAVGRLWLEQGNAYVVANLRGGGEFGPQWHQAAQGATKQTTWDDFIAVAEDLIRRKITSPRRLGVIGGSQGGLLVGAAITQRPELFNAAIIQVPLFDMLRYTSLGAGASWIAEYGDPAIAEQRAWIEAYSPYQKLVPGKTYPAPFILTSTKDDRVHPAHGRKAAARLAALGQPYFYYENIDGGHSAAANLVEHARRLALEYTYASKRLCSD